MIAVGEKAKMMYEKTHDNIRTYPSFALMALSPTLLPASR